MFGTLMLPTFRPIFALLDRRFKSLSAICALIRLIELLAIFGTALVAARGKFAWGLGGALLVGALVFIRSWVSAHLTERARRVLVDALARALFDGDLLAHPAHEGHETEPLVISGVLQAIRVLSATIPVFLGNAAAAVVLTVVVAAVFPRRLIAAMLIAALAACTVLVFGH